MVLEEPCQAGRDGLRSLGHPVCARTVASLLVLAGWWLQANAKTREGRQRPDRDAQFRYINQQVAGALAGGHAAVSVDTKKKELVGDFKNAGRELRRNGQPAQVRAHDFKDKELGKVAPYGVYDLRHDEGFVWVGSPTTPPSSRPRASSRGGSSWDGSGSRTPQSC